MSFFLGLDFYILLAFIIDNGVKYGIVMSASEFL